MTERTHDDPRMLTKRQELRRFGAPFIGGRCMLICANGIFW
jgi:hypothetical protein